MHVRVELPVGLDELDAVPLEERCEGAVDETHTFFELRLLVLLGSGERPLEVVDHRQELDEQPRVRKRDVLLSLARDPLLVVLEVGGEAQETVVCLLLLHHLDLDVLVTHW